MVDREAPPEVATIDRFRTLADNIREIFWILDPETGKLLYVNPAFTRITGLPTHEAYQDPESWIRLVDARDRNRVREELEQRNRTGEPHNLEFRILRPDGDIRWVWMRGLPVEEDSRGTVIVGVVEDITERKQAEEHLEESLSLLRTTLQATADGILGLDRKGRIVAFNSRFVELWRIPDFVAIESGGDEALRERMLRQLRDPDAFLKKLSEIARQPREDSFDILEFTDGRIFEAYSRPRRVGDELDGRVWSFRDTTDRVRAERELRARTHRLEVQQEVLLELARLQTAENDPCQAVLRRIVDTAADLLGVARVGVWRFDRNRTSIEQLALSGADETCKAPLERIEKAEAPAYFAALEEERTVPIDDVRSDPRTADAIREYCEAHGITSMMDAPIRVGGEVVGVVCFEHVGPPRRWTVEDESFAGSIGDMVSIVLETRERRRVEAGLRFLAQAGSLLNSSLDYVQTISRVAQLAVPVVADWCAVDIIENGMFRRVASRHSDPEREELLASLGRRFPPDPDTLDESHPLKTGLPEIVPEMDLGTLQARVPDPEHRRMLQELGIRSYMAVPLRARDRVLGALTLAAENRTFDESDFALAQELADRAAAAIDNAALYDEAQNSDHAKSNFLAIMSHELRTPLSAIQGYAELMLSGVSGPVNDTQREQLQRIKLRAQDLARIFDEMLSFARTSAETEKARLKPTDIVQLLREVADTYKPTFDEAGLEFRVVLPDGPLMIETDAKLVEQILDHLLSNAAHFTDEGWVELKLVLQDGDLLIQVGDTGIGVDPANQQRIFEPFFQVEESTTREKGGTGLGLAVARQYATALGGDISISSVPGEGSVFTVRLPREPTAGEGGRSGSG